MKNNKFYTPTIEEFHVGFEYEIYEPIPYYDNNEMPYVWKQQVFHASTFDTEIETRDGEMPFTAGIYEKKIRVKYLDKEDIESLGWKFIREEFNTLDIFTMAGKKSDCTTSELKLVMNTNKKFIDITYIEEYLYTPTAESSTSYRVFQGTIKNISELKTLMKWLQIA